MITEFKINQKVVYPCQGVGVVMDIVDRPFNGEVVKHYKIYVQESDMNVFIPVQNVGMIGIRAIVSAEEAKKALDSLSIDCGPVTSDWKLRYQQNLELLKKGSADDIASIVRSLYQRSKVKELPILERKLYDNATKHLIDEVSFALGIPAEEVERMIHAKLEPLGAAVVKKAPITDDDDDDDEYPEENDSNDSDDDSDDDSDSDSSDSDSDDDDDDDED